jgi:Glycoside Hydrolase Family 113
VTRKILGAVLVVTLSGCAGVGAGPGVPAPNDWTTLSSPAPARPPLKIEGVPVSEVAPAARMLRAALGIQVSWDSPGPRARQEAQANRIFNYVVGLGANSVAINFFFYTDGEYPTRVYRVRGGTPPPATIAMVVANAREHGLRVLVRPLLNDDNIKVIKGDWRGSIEPRSAGAWFASYLGFLKPYLIAAQDSGATGFGVDTELDSLAGDEGDWASLRAAAAKLFDGQLVSAVNYGLWQQDKPGEPVPDAALDAYPPLGVASGATVPELTAAWLSWLRGHRPAVVLERTVLQEVGISAVAGAYAAPALTAPSGTPLDIPVQRKWFAAACAAAKTAHLAGVYFFDVNSTDDPLDPAATAGYAPGSFIGRSDGVISACFRSGWS